MRATPKTSSPVPSISLLSSNDRVHCFFVEEVVVVVTDPRGPGDRAEHSPAHEVLPSLVPFCWMCEKDCGGLVLSCPDAEEPEQKFESAHGSWSILNVLGAKVRQARCSSGQLFFSSLVQLQRSFLFLSHTSTSSTLNNTDVCSTPLRHEPDMP